MSDLTGNTVASTYKNLVQVPTANAGISTSLIQLQDGAGNNIPAWVATNKTQFDSTIQLVDSADNTKILKFTLSGITTGTTRTWVLPDTSDTFVGATTNQTLTNKTLTTPVIASLKPDASHTISFTASTDTVVMRQTTDTLTNKTINGANNTLTVRLANDVSGTLPVLNGGTGQTTYTNGQLLIGNTSGNTLTKATLTAGTGITITNSTGSITIATSGGGSGASTGLAYSLVANRIWSFAY